MESCSTKMFGYENGMDKKRNWGEFRKGDFAHMRQTETKKN